MEEKAFTKGAKKAESCNGKEDNDRPGRYIDASDLLEQIIEFLPDATFVIDRQGKVIAWNKAIEKMTGIKAEDIIGKGEYEYSLAFYKDRRPVLIDLVNNPVEDILASYEYVRREGDILVSETAPNRLILGDIHLFNLACPLYNKKGEVIGAIECIRDITEQKKVENARLDSESKYSNLFGAAGDAIFIMEGELFSDCNPKTLEMFACSRNQIIGKPPYLFSPEVQPDGRDSREKATEKVQAALKGQPQFFEWRHRRHDGTLFDTEVSLNAFSAGGKRFIQAIVRDITERKQGEEALAKSEATLRSILAAAPVGISVMKDRRYQSANRYWCDCFGYPEETILGKTTRMLYEREEDYNRVGQELYAGLSQKGIASTETRLKRSDGSLRDCIVTVAHIDADNPSEGTVAVVEDVTERRKAEKALIRSQERYRDLVEESFDGIFIQEGPRIVFANKRLHEMLGFQEGELIGMDHWLIYHPDYRDLTRERAAARMKGEKVLSNYEVKLQRKDGAWLYGEISAKAIRLESEEGIQVWIKDITDRKLSEDAIKKSEKRFRDLFDSVSDLVFTQDLEGRFLTANLAMTKLFGYEPDEFLGHKAADFMKPELRSFFESVYLEKLRKEGHHEGVTAYFARDGRKVHIEYNSSLIKPAEGEHFISGIGRDVTERVASERINQEREASIRAILQAAPNPIIVYDTDARAQFLNPAFTAVFGWTIEDMKVEGVAFVPSEEKEETVASLKALYRKEEPGPLATRRITKDGRILDVLINASLIKGEGTRPTGIVLGFTDLTNLKKLEAQLIQAQKMESVGRLAGGVAHDFNNMLGVILGRVELALMGLDPADPLSNDLLDIQKAAKRSADLTKQLLGFARRQTVAPKVIDLNDKIARMLNMLRRLIGEDIELEWFPCSDPLPVKIDPTQLDQIFANLCVNARDAIEDVGTITIETENTILGEEHCRRHPYISPGRFVSIIVSDTGCGMEKDIIEKIFDPFFTTKEVGKGTGLGLATVYGIVKQNEGHINVYSEPGKGTTFKIYLPAAGKASERDSSPHEYKEIEGGSETVLLVEDEPLVLQMGEMILKRLGYNVLPAEGPNQALEIARAYENEIALLLTDVVMPEMNGMELSERIGSLKPGIKCLFTSGYTANVIARHGILKEGVQFIQKPFVINELSRKIRQVLA